MDSVALKDIDATADDYKLGRFVLNFRDPAIERRFEHESLESSLNFIRAYLIAGISLYALFGILDTIVGGAALHSMLTIRYVVVCPILLSILALTYFPIFRRISQPLLSLAMLTSGLGVVAMTAVMPPPFNSQYYAGIIMVVSYCGSLIRLRFSNSTLCAIFLFLAYQPVALGINPIPQGTFVANDFFLAMATGVGLFSSYIQELYFRRSYIAQKVVEARNELTAQLLIESDKANHSKSEFLATMSHELRTPLNAVIGFSDIIKREMFGTLGDKRYVEYANDIHESGAHLLSIINDILDLAKAESGTLQLSVGQFDVSEVIGKCVRMNQPRAEAGKVSLIYENPHAAIEILGDERYVLQIINNLVTNAVKFTPAGGQVTITAAADPETGILVQVRDTGVGIAPEHLARVLKPFEQVAGAYARQMGGTGLGLPYAKRLAELHGGTLSLQSAPKKGTIASIMLPSNRLVSIGQRVPASDAA